MILSAQTIMTMTFMLLIISTMTLFASASMLADTIKRRQEQREYSLSDHARLTRIIDSIIRIQASYRLSHTLCQDKSTRNYMAIQLAYELLNRGYIKFRVSQDPELNYDSYIFTASIITIKDI